MTDPNTTAPQPAPEVVKDVAADVAKVADAVASGEGVSSLATGLIRTLVPIGVGGLLGWLVSLGFPDLGEAGTDGLTALGVFVVGSAYYTGVRFAERKWPWTGWFLGKAAQPVYPSK